jgi:hypothetical protein
MNPVGVASLKLNYFLEAVFPNQSHWGLQIMNFRRTQIFSLVLGMPIRKSLELVCNNGCLSFPLPLFLNGSAYCVGAWSREGIWMKGKKVWT